MSLAGQKPVTWLNIATRHHRPQHPRPECFWSATVSGYRHPGTQRLPLASDSPAQRAACVRDEQGPVATGATTLAGKPETPTPAEGRLLLDRSRWWDAFAPSLALKDSVMPITDKLSRRKLTVLPKIQQPRPQRSNEAIAERLRSAEAGVRPPTHLPNRSKRLCPMRRAKRQPTMNAQALRQR